MAEQESTVHKLQAAAYFILAGGFAISGWAAIHAARKRPAGDRAPIGALPAPTNSPAQAPVRGARNLRRGPLPIAAAPVAGAPAEKRVDPQPKGRMHDVGTIDERVALIQQLIRKGSTNPTLHEKTVEILSQKCDSLGNIYEGGAAGAGLKWCVPEKDCWREVEWLFNAIRKPSSRYAVRYTRDMILADTFTAAERTLLKKHGGDCDDYTVLLGAMLMSIGHPVRVRVIAANGSRSWSHVYLVTPERFDDSRSRWRAVDCSVDKPCGWEAPGAETVARTGKPAGIVTRLKDFRIPESEGVS